MKKYSDIQGWFDFGDIYFDMVTKCSDNAHFVEVGTWLGKSAAFMAEIIKESKKNIRFDCVDIWEYISSEPYYHTYKNDVNDLYMAFLMNMKDTNSLDHIKPIKLNSVDAAKLYDDESLDFAFIDASHQYENVKKDIQVWLPKIKKGGFLAGHDYVFIDVKKAVDELFGENKQIIGTSWIVKK